ncbi:MAG: hypothetical protein E3J66_07075 [Dehalococcoidia bacterium]|nr:MAG: hypothetical protein E3J66_07075 [Dehalococcoidia bacterium]
MAKILVIEGDKATLLDKIKFTGEGKLQDYLEKYPSLIPLGEIVEGASDLLCIGREVGVPSGSIDLLFIDKDGLLTVVETKLARNPEARRTVIGQIIEYASYISKWTADDVYRVANGYLKSNLDEIIGERSEQEFLAEDFRSNIEQNLKDGKIRCIIAVDELVEPLRATVSFLNSYSNFDILLLQVSSFEESKARTVLIPSLFGYATKTIKTDGPRRQWNEDTFFADLEKRAEESEIDIVRELYNFTKGNADKTSWGTGAFVGSFPFRKSRYGISVSIFTVQSDGWIWLNFGQMKGTNVKEGILESFRAKLNEIPGINIPEEVVSIGKFPGITTRVLTEAENLRNFQDAVMALCQQMESSEQ